MLCGTPLIASAHSCFVETIAEGCGFRCRTLADWLWAIERVGSLDRAKVASTARARFDMEALAREYDNVFAQIRRLSGKGWYDLTN